MAVNVELAFVGSMVGSNSSFTSTISSAITTTTVASPTTSEQMDCTLQRLSS